MLIAGLLVGSAAAAEMPNHPPADGEPLIEASDAAVPAPVVQSIAADASGATGDAKASLPAQLVVAAPPRPAESPAASKRPRASSPSTASGVAATVSGGLASLVARFRSSSVASRELECLAGAIYFESKSEPLIGQLAVGQVIANRSKSGRFPSTYCGVVFQRGQFSFVRNRSMPAIARSSLQWRTAVAIAQIVDRAMHVGQATKALFFHARRVSPGWRLTRLATIGNHVFYR